MSMKDEYGNTIEPTGRYLQSCRLINPRTHEALIVVGGQEVRIAKRYRAGRPRRHERGKLRFVAPKTLCEEVNMRLRAKEEISFLDIDLGAILAVGR